MGAVPRADIVPWTDDPRLRRVMHTFHHADQQGGAPPRLGLTELLAAMDANAVEAGILAAKVYYPTTIDRLHSLHQEFARLSAASAGRLRWIATIMPPEHGPGSYWDLMQNPRIVAALAGAPGLVGCTSHPRPGAWRRTIAGTTRSMPNAWNWA